MKFNFVGRCNKLIPNTIVLDEAENKWRVLLGGLLKVDRYDGMDDAAAAVDHATSLSTETPEQAALKAGFAVDAALVELSAALRRIGYLNASLDVEAFKAQTLSPVVGQLMRLERQSATRTEQ